VWLLRWLGLHTQFVSPRELESLLAADVHGRLCHVAFAVSPRRGRVKRQAWRVFSNVMVMPGVACVHSQSCLSLFRSICLAPLIPCCLQISCLSQKGLLRAEDSKRLGELSPMLADVLWGRVEWLVSYCKSCLRAICSNAGTDRLLSSFAPGFQRAHDAASGVRSHAERAARLAAPRFVNLFVLRSWPLCTHSWFVRAAIINALVAGDFAECEDSGKFWVVKILEADATRVRVQCTSFTLLVIFWMLTLTSFGVLLQTTGGSPSTLSGCREPRRVWLPSSRTSTKKSGQNLLAVAVRSVSHVVVLSFLRVVRQCGAPRRSSLT
jgi:hypothetical protein